MPRQLPAVTFEPGDKLTPPDGNVQCLIALTEGWAARTVAAAPGETRISGLFLKGELCDPLWLAGQAREPVIALTRVRGIAAPLDDVNLLMARKRLMQRKIFADIAQRSLSSAKWIASLGRLSAMQRVAYVLCDLASRLGHRPGRRALRFRVPLNDAHLADIAGVTVGHLRRAVTELRACDLATLARQTIQINDLGRLERVSQFRATQPGAEHRTAPNWPSELMTEL